MISSRYFAGVDGAASSVERAVAFYEAIKNLPSSTTKVVLQDHLNLHINGPFSLRTPNILTAIDEEENQFVVKLLRTDMDRAPLDIQRIEFEQEPKTCKILELSSPTVALCATEVIKVMYEERSYVALKMPRYLTTLQDTPKAFPRTLVTQGRRLADAVCFMHSKNIVHMDIKADNIFISPDKRWVLGDFGSSKVAGERITTSNLIAFMRTKLDKAVPELDWFMLLLVLLKESLATRDSWIKLLCDNDEKYDATKIEQCILALPAEVDSLRDFLLELWCKAASALVI